MSSSNLMQWSGLAALSGGVLLVVCNILEFVLFGSQSDSAAVTSSAWIIVEIAFVLTETLMILGLVGLYAHQARQTGTLGLVAFVIALTGTVMVSGVDWSAAFFGPWLAELAPQSVDAEPSGALLAGFILTLVLLAFGWFLFGLASLRAEVLPRGSAVLLMVGAVLSFVLIFLEFPFEVVVLGAALAWMGYALWSGTTDEPARMAGAEAAT